MEFLVENIFRFGFIVDGEPIQESYCNMQVGDNPCTTRLAFTFGSDDKPYLKADVVTNRYGLNGKENDNEIKGEGNQQDYGFRIYDPRVGRFLSVDPLKKKYPYYSTYQFTGNNPIRYIDLDGLEPANNPKAPGAKENRAMTEISLIETKTAKNDLSITFNADSTFKMNMKVPFMYDSIGTWKARNMNEWNWLIFKSFKYDFSNENSGSQFTRPYDEKFGHFLFNKFCYSARQCRCYFRYLF